MDFKLVTNTSLSNLMNGALEELFQIAQEEVIRNIEDANTDQDKERKITIEIKYKKEGTGYIVTSANAIPKLQPSKPIEGGMFVSRARGGRVTLSEHVVAQGELDLTESIENATTTA